MTRKITCKWDKKYNVVFTDHSNNMKLDMEFRNIFGGEYYEDKVFMLEDNEKISSIFDKMRHTSKNLVAGVTFEIPPDVSLRDAIENYTPKGLEYVQILRPDINSIHEDLYDFLYNGDTKYMEIKKNGEVLTQNSRLPERTDEMKLLVREFSEALSPMAQDHIILTDRWRIYNAKHCYTDELCEKYRPVVSENVGCITGKIERDEETGIIKAEFIEIKNIEPRNPSRYEKGDRVTVEINGNIDENRLAMIESVHNCNLKGLLSAMEFTLMKPDGLDVDSEFPIRSLDIKAKNMEKAIAYMESVNAFRPEGKQVPARAVFIGTEFEYKNDVESDDSPEYIVRNPFDTITYSKDRGLETNVVRTGNDTIYNIMDRFVKVCENSSLEIPDTEKKKIYEEMELAKKGAVKNKENVTENKFHFKDLF